MSITQYVTLSSSTYFGGKGASGTFQKIINQIPPHNVFISGFLGRCAVMRFKKPAEVNIGIDLNLEIIEDWEQSLEASEDFFFYNSDFQTTCVTELSNLLSNPNTFLYLDPPYLMSTRKGKRPVYKHEFHTKREHIELINFVLENANCNVAISSYPNELYDTRLKDWRRITFDSSTRQGLATEALYMNYEKPKRLQDYSFMGADYRERELIKRRARNIVRKIDSLPPQEKGRLFEYLKESYPELSHKGAVTS